MDLENENNYLEIDKLHIAGHQIDSAIHLFFTTLDHVSVLTLSAAAWRVLSDILAEESIRHKIIELFEGRFDRTEVRDSLNKLPNFCKHADKENERNFHAKEKFYIPYIENCLMYAIQDFSRVNEMSQQMKIFNLWHISKYRNFYQKNEYELFYVQAIEVFPNLPNLSDKEQRICGQIELLKLS
jgi:hypothetical protein